jgi:drug/metabolite transporter (DMT)-like permease
MAADAPSASLSPAGAFGLLGLTAAILGFNWPLLAIALEDISPMWLSTLRLAGGTIVVVSVSMMRGRMASPARADVPLLLSVGILRLALVMVLVFIALRFVPPGRASVLVWTASLWTVPMAAIVLSERMTRRRWIGLMVGISGIVVLVEPWHSHLDARALLGYGLLLVAAIAQAATSVHIRRHHWVSSPLALLPWQLVVATVPVAALTFAVEGPLRVDWTPLLIAIVVYEGALASGVAMWAQLTVLRRLPAVTTNLTLMMVPVVGLVSSMLVVGEQLTVPAAVGAVAIAVGVTTGVGLDRKTPV